MFKFCYERQEETLEVSELCKVGLDISPWPGEDQSLGTLLTPSFGSHYARACYTYSLGMHFTREALSRTPTKVDDLMLRLYSAMITASKKQCMPLWQS